MSEYVELRKRIIAREFSRMNNMQREAVMYTEGPLLILAGAGSGKTTVLVNRIANLIKYGKSSEYANEPPFISEADMALLRACAAGTAPVDARVVDLLACDPCPAWRILAITFTNKAAGELKERIGRILGDAGNEVMACTFHSFCARLLRYEGARLGFSSHFTIYDTDDSRRLMKECMKTLNIEEKILSVKSILGEISRAKDALLSPEAFEQTPQAQNDFRLKKVAACYKLYQTRLREADAMDFDDLLSRTVELLQNNPDVLEKYRKRYRYIMVDEYQDTNYAQYRLVSLLANGGNLCVVGDDDQSIYKFRGATVENILSFEQEFKGCRVIRLEQNYRSTQNILDAANAVIAHNKGRMGKTLWTENPRGDRLHLRVVDNAEEEARFIADSITSGVGKGRRYSDFAVLYRSNAQSNAIEQALIRSAVPYRIIGGHRFNDTQEIRDAMAYLRVVNNTGDEVALRRIINQPRRGIGDTTLDRAAEIAVGLGIPMFEVLSHAADYPEISRAAGRIAPFIELIASLRSMNDDPEVSLHMLYVTMLQDSGYLSMWQLQGEAEADRVDNLRELESTILRFEQNAVEEPSLSGFLEEQALLTDIDNYNASADTCVLMTMHAAKGLEFPVVFLPGFEDGVFPGMQSIYNPDELEEERRLCYVAITRAKEQLYLLRAESRMLYGSTTRNRQSRFLGDIPVELVESPEKPKRSSYSGFGSTGRSDVPRSSFHKAPAQSVMPRAGTVYQAPVAPSVPLAKYAVGQRVEHTAFGVGAIEAVQPMGNDTMLTIRFERVGTKKLMATFAKLKVLD